MNEQQLALAKEYAWGYFSLHANQRLQTFNFFIMFATLVATGMFASLHKDFLYPVASVFLGLLLTLLAYIFWKLDCRNQMLVKNAENALLHLEERFAKFGDESIMLVKRDDDEMRSRRLIGSIFGRMVLSYSESFLVVFVLFALAGMLGFTLGVYTIIRAGF